MLHPLQKIYHTNFCFLPPFNFIFPKSSSLLYARSCVCVCVCVCARARARARASHTYGIHSLPCSETERERVSVFTGKQSKTDGILHKCLQRQRDRSCKPEGEGSGGIGVKLMWKVTHAHTHNFRHISGCGLQVKWHRRVVLHWAEMTGRNDSSSSLD